MRSGAVLWGIVAAALATAMNLVHGVAHAGQDVMLMPYWHWGYIIGVIFLAPILAAVLLGTRYGRAGAWLLVLSMAGSLVFDVAYHFLVPGPDNVFTLPSGAWTLAFRVSAVLVALASGVGFLAGVRALRELSSPVGGPVVDVPVRPEPGVGRGPR